MKISVFGLGYVGAVVSGCLAAKGHQVTGVDAEPGKVALVNSGRSPIVEKQIGEILAAEVAAGRLSATTDAAAAVASSDLIMVCVGTPSRSNGDIDLCHVQRVCEQIGTALRAHPGAPDIVIRSTMLPGTTHDVVIPALEASSGREAGTDFGVCVNPEFLREGSAVADYLNPPKTVIGELNRASGDVLASLYTDIDAPLVRTDIETAEMVKYADNAWHALKVGFANEIGHFCKSQHVDSHRVMEIFCRDTSLNLSACYLKPGFAFGGSCLPKDLKALLHRAQTADVSLPILQAVLPSNELQIQRAVQTVIDHGSRRIGILGLSFKAGSDDLRNSPVVEMAERLLGKGYQLRIYDHNVKLASLRGTNREYILNRIPHLSALLTSSIEEVLEHAETLVIGNASPEFRAILPRVGFRQTVIDLVRIGDCHSVSGIYEGVCW